MNKELEELEKAVMAIQVNAELVRQHKAFAPFLKIVDEIEKKAVAGLIENYLWDE